MKKSWISIFMPKDEYKERRIIYFLAESAILMAIISILLIITNTYIGLTSDIAPLLIFVFFIFYISLRYILSGMEYTDVSTLQSYRKQKKIIVYRSLTFLFTFSVAYILIVGVPSNNEEWIDLMGVGGVSAIMMLVTSRLSLKRSYHKNKDILDQ
ncbi:DUF3278 domain-containing protein [Radiobacillus deserti]|uniref:DUF3278 domain-containing protein n=1 Tax=Radiobacillus deserti TaxID=2594883 RepID=A0A516KI81_9BACI|nr:DUF3278 domain-containing protein [Radiobacillus deserti]QDP41081.1 DUF3278 domain-containing protein [Radiobacillus deserti]